MSFPGDDLRATVHTAAKALRTLPAEAAARPRAPGKWSPKEIIGHLIDSASNNHGRFVRAQLDDSMRFQGYEQDDWVRVQGYSEADWNTLIDLWEAFNLRLAHIMDLVPENVRSKPRDDHNLNEVGFRPLSENTPATLEWFMHDYVAHLKHHLRQIDPVALG